MKNQVFIALSVVALTLAACGQKGPLYLPGRVDSQSAPPATAPAVPHSDAEAAKE